MFALVSWRESARNTGIMANWAGVVCVGKLRGLIAHCGAARGAAPRSARSATAVVGSCRAALSVPVKWTSRGTCRRCGCPVLHQSAVGASLCEAVFTRSEPVFTRRQVESGLRQTVFTPRQAVGEWIPVDAGRRQLESTRIPMASEWIPMVFN